MIRFNWAITLFLGFAVGGAALADDLPVPVCADGKTCTVEMPGSQCGDGTQSFFRVTYRKDAKGLFVFLNGGGACWDKKSCKCDDNGVCQGGSASAGLTRISPDSMGGWDNGMGWRDSTDGHNPIAKGYNVIEMPYCTGDVYTGANDANYGTAAKPIVVRHQGAKNVRMMFEKASKMFPSPDKVVFMGCSAGGLGVTYNVHQLRATYPQTPAYVISDSGLPFKAPHVNPAKFRQVVANWGSEKSIPGIDSGPDGALDFGDVLRHNGTKFPDVRFALISAYKDSVMTLFASMMGATKLQTVVSDTMIDTADNDMVAKDSQKVFYLEGSRHCFNGKAPKEVTSLDSTLADFASSMIEDDRGWENVRPR